MHYRRTAIKVQYRVGSKINRGSGLENSSKESSKAGWDIIEGCEAFSPVHEYPKFSSFVAMVENKTIPLDIMIEKLEEIYKGHAFTR